MLSKEDLLKNIDELYDSYIRSESERLRLKSLNSKLWAEVAKKQKLIAALKAKFSELSDKAVTRIRQLKEIITALKAENETLRQKSAPAFLTPSSEWPREFLFLKGSNTGGIVPNFWTTYRNNFPLGKIAGDARKYDLYIGYLFEYRGFDVEYCGINSRAYDGGIDLICRKDNWAVLVRCKEKGMNTILMHYLAARALSFKMDNPNINVGALCVTSANLSDNAKNVADKFSIAVKDGIPFQNFPYVKCKVLADGTKVHYTPLNDEYLTTRIIPQNGDMFCADVNDAVQNGFFPA